MANNNTPEKKHCTAVPDFWRSTSTANEMKHLHNIPTRGHHKPWKMTVVEFIISNTVPWWSLLAATGQLLINIFSNVAMMAYAFFNANGIAFWLPENHQEDKGLLIFNGSMIIKEVMGLLLSQFVSIIKALPYAHFDCISDSSKIPTYYWEDPRKIWTFHLLAAVQQEILFTWKWYGESCCCS